MFYYGVEVGIWSGDDPDCRKPMPWPDLKMEMEKTDPLGRARAEDDPNFDETIHAFYREAIALHAALTAFRTHGFAVLTADDDKNIFVYRRGTGDDLRVVALNRSNEEQAVRLGVPAGGIAFVTQGEASSILLTGEENSRLLTLPPLRGGVVK